MHTKSFSSSLLLISLAGLGAGALGCTQSATQKLVAVDGSDIEDEVQSQSNEEDSNALVPATSQSSYGDANNTLTGPISVPQEVRVVEPAAPTPAPPTEIAFESLDVAAGLSAKGEGGAVGTGHAGAGLRAQPRVITRRGSGQGGQAFTSRGGMHVGAPAPHANTEQYTHYGVNDTTATSEDRFSTFSIDVDTASYTIARRKLQEGQTPPASSVRVEEFINYFPYRYAPPSTDAPFAVHMEAAPDPFNEGHHLFRVGIKAQDLDLSNRKPVHLTFLVDVSGSMNRADKLGLAKKSLRHLTDQLRPGDTVALATYAGRVSAVLEPTDVTEKATIHDAIEQLNAAGSTAMNSGIQLAYNMAQAGFVSGEENRVIVLSDGDANVGPSSHQAILESIKGHAKRGITLSTIGFGMGNYKDTMMEQLANQGDGNYYYIDSLSEARKIFGKDLAGTLQVIAKDVKIQVEFNPNAVETYRLIGYENRDIADRDFRNDTVDAGEIGTGHTVTALYDLVLSETGSEDLATVRIRNKQPGPDSPAVEWMTAFETRELKSAFSNSTNDFQIAVAAAAFAELLRNSPYAAEIGWQDLSALAAKAQRPGVAEDDELLGLIQRASSLSGARGATAER